MKVSAQVGIRKRQDRLLHELTPSGSNQDPLGRRNLSAFEGIGPDRRNRKADAMQLGYLQPFSFRINPRREPKISSIRHGVTEITLSDGRLVRATLHVKSIKSDPNTPGALDVSYDIVAEIMAKSVSPILDAHETLQ